MTRSRGQLVLLAAVALAIALVPMTLAYLQLGYHEDVRAVTVDDTPIRDTESALRRAFHDATASVPGDHPWSNRTAAVDTVRDHLRPTLRSLNASLLDSGSALTITYNRSRAAALSNADCPGGPDRKFGPCVADRGFVLQERDGRTHVLAAAVDVELATPRGDRAATLVVRSVPDRT